MKKIILILAFISSSLESLLQAAQSHQISLEKALSAQRNFHMAECNEDQEFWNNQQEPDDALKEEDDFILAQAARELKAALLKETTHLAQQDKAKRTAEKDHKKSFDAAGDEQQYQAEERDKHSPKRAKTINKEVL